MTKSKKPASNCKAETRGGKSGHTPRSKTDHPLNIAAYRQAAVRIATGELVRAVAREHGLTESQGRRIGEICAVPIEEFREYARTKLQTVQKLIFERLENDVKNLKPMEAVVSCGIFSDKLRDLTSSTAPTVVHTTNIQVNGIDRATALALLSGARKTVNAPMVTPPPVV